MFMFMIWRAVWTTLASVRHVCYRQTNVPTFVLCAFPLRHRKRGGWEPCRTGGGRRSGVQPAAGLVRRRRAAGGKRRVTSTSGGQQITAVTPAWCVACTGGHGVEGFEEALRAVGTNGACRRVGIHAWQEGSRAVAGTAGSQIDTGVGAAAVMEPFVEGRIVR
ncbi:hypothetical protein GGX14DRAFT_402989 [Mycena pura]|uniref:Secreted protein n=1 Tax=Mycena pura TaxID=153505 RepID=A0AAD6Y318_9AGAR|nr:hypothetical protein GGX14DRAFT_402989 [Mycena pura]